MHFAIDTGGTFTDLVILDEMTGFRLFKAPTTPDDPTEGMLDVFRVASASFGTSLRALMERGELLIYATTRATNAILTHSTARTALLLTEGHPDILVFREGGRKEPFNHTRAYPQPFVPRSLTYEIPERINASGAVVQQLDDAAVLRLIDDLRSGGIEAIAVCLLWAVINPVHELRIGEMLEQHLPGVPYTLSHRLNPTLREYRRASSAAIDASLKPLMTGHLMRVDERLRSEGFNGRLLVVTSNGGFLDSTSVAAAPIYTVSSGPSMAPVAGRWFAAQDARAEVAIIADTGGTSYDVSLVRHGHIPTTREAWLGEPFVGHITALPAVDVKSIGAGGGSIAWVDEGGLLHVGPESAGAVPGPVCYQRGGTRPTVTDAALTLGYIDPTYFLAGVMQLDATSAGLALTDQVGRRLGLPTHEAAAAVLSVVTEQMVKAIEEITVNQGVDPRDAVLIGGGGAAGLNAVAIARRLGCQQIVVPAVGAALSAAGAMLSDLTGEFSAALYTSTSAFNIDRVNQVLEQLVAKCQEFIAGPGAGSLESHIEIVAEARYPHQVWELDLPIRAFSFDSQADVAKVALSFHSLHESVFAISDHASPVEFVAWRARARCRLHDAKETKVAADEPRSMNSTQRRPAYFRELGFVETPVQPLVLMQIGSHFVGPVIVESPVTTVVVPPGADVERLRTGSLSIRPFGDKAPESVSRRETQTDG